MYEYFLLYWIITRGIRAAADVYHFMKGLISWFMNEWGLFNLIFQTDYFSYKESISKISVSEDFQ